MIQKPRAKENNSNQNNEPLFTKEWARFSPIGKSPNLRPETKKVKPRRIDKVPKSMTPISGMACLSTMIWKKATTKTIGSKSLQLSSKLFASLLRTSSMSVLLS